MVKEIISWDTHLVQTKEYPPDEREENKLVEPQGDMNNDFEAGLKLEIDINSAMGLEEMEKFKDEKVAFPETKYK